MCRCEQRTFLRRSVYISGGMNKGQEQKPTVVSSKIHVVFCSRVLEINDSEGERVARCNIEIIVGEN